MITISFGFFTYFLLSFFNYMLKQFLFSGFLRFILNYLLLWLLLGLLLGLLWRCLLPDLTASNPEPSSLVHVHEHEEGKYKHKPPEGGIKINNSQEDPKTTHHVNPIQPITVHLLLIVVFVKHGPRRARVHPLIGRAVSCSRGRVLIGCRWLIDSLLGQW